ncbi:MAG TPA: TetR/AcrR family transcriptional regulator [bacterium]|nr:TetR/AcrR family transcriptional regulator [bacterium]
MAKRADFVESRRNTRRNQIFKGAVKVLADKGYHSATTQEIADAAGLAKGTVYEYVKNKEDILLLVMEEGLSMLKNDINKIFEKTDDPRERLKQLILVQLKFAKKYKDSAKVVLHEVNNLTGDGRKMFLEQENELVEITRSVIDDGIKRGYFKKINSRLAAELFEHASKFYFDYGNSPYHKSTLNEISDFILSNYLRAILVDE